MTDTDPKFLIVDVPLEFRLPEADIIEQATRVGREAGMDEAWVPETLEEAVSEILISGGGDVALGVVPRMDLAGTPTDLFHLEIEVLAPEDESFLDRTDRLRPSAWPRDAMSATLAALMSPEPPLDWNIEVIEVITDPPASNHEAILREKRIAASLRLGRDCATASR